MGDEEQRASGDDGPRQKHFAAAEPVDGLAYRETRGGAARHTGDEDQCGEADVDVEGLGQDRQNRRDDAHGKPEGDGGKVEREKQRAVRAELAGQPAGLGF